MKQRNMKQRKHAMNPGESDIQFAVLVLDLRNQFSAVHIDT